MSVFALTLLHKEIKGEYTDLFEGLLINALILLASLLVLDKASHLAITNSVKVVRKRLDELQKMVSKKPRTWTR